MDDGTDYGGLIGLLGAAGLASAGALYANYKNRKLQQSINEDVISLANTAHQREVADLRAAGLNPILSATGNGASVPSLGTPHQDNVLSDFGSSARSIGQTLSKQRSADIAKTEADTDASIATAKNLEEQNKNLKAQNAEIAARVENIKADTNLKRADEAVKDTKKYQTPVGRGYSDVKEVYKDATGAVERWINNWKDPFSGKFDPPGVNSAGSLKKADWSANLERMVREKNGLYNRGGKAQPLLWMKKHAPEGYYK